MINELFAWGTMQQVLRGLGSREQADVVVGEFQAEPGPCVLPSHQGQGKDGAPSQSQRPDRLIVDA